MLNPTKLWVPRGARCFMTEHRVAMINKFHEPKRVTAEQALQQVLVGDSVFVHTGCAAPQPLVDALVDRAQDFRNNNGRVEFVHLHTECAARYVQEQYADVFSTRCLFVGGNVRAAVNAPGGRAQYVPCFLSEIPLLIRNGAIAVDVALISVSPPDRHGYVTLGPSVDCTPQAIESARTVIALQNKHVPRTHGDSVVHVSCLDYIVEQDHPLPTYQGAPLTDVHHKVAANVAQLIPDGATLQMGIGTIPDAVLSALSNHTQLGIHTEMFSDNLIPLIEGGVISGAAKELDRNQVVSSFVIGSQQLFDYIDDNPSIKLMRSSYVNNPYYIKQNPNVCAINSCTEIDVTGQIVADSVGDRIISGIGGQLDFMRAASLSAGGKAIMAITSRSKRGHPRIVPHLTSGSGVTTTRGHTRYVVTEYGTTPDLAGKTLQERAELLINIAHPEDRDHLRSSIKFLN